jgi:predicted negative regulator of RcsB-dependent stress response
MPSIFISHSSKDNFAAVALKDWLARVGWDDVFLDLDPERGIAAGERWERALHEQANRCEAVVFLVSGQWLASPWCLKEYWLARTLNKKLFAVLIDPAKSVADLPAELKGTWQAVDLAGGQDGVLLRAKLPGSHEEGHAVFSQEGLRRLKRGLDKAGLDPKFFAWPPENEPGRAPYRGLDPLEAEDAGVFFGRDAPIIEATDRLRGLKAAAPPRLLVLLGASGAGKSSFLRAGLLPRLARDDRNFIALAPIRPGRAALTGGAGLVAALQAARPDLTRAALIKTVEAGADAVRALLADLAQRIPPSEGEKPPAIVLSVDQAEELFRPEGAAEGTALLALIRELVSGESPALIAIFAIRSDSYDALEHAKPLEGLSQATLPLLPMPRGAYKEVIEGPARRFAEAGAMLRIEPQLTERLLEDIEKGAGSDALPLLAFTLQQLFRDHRQAGALTLQHYDDFRGLKGAIDAAVERAFVRADSDPRIPADRAAREALLRRGLIPWLAGVDAATRSPRRNIARRSEIPPEAAPLIALLVEERLLSTDTRLERDASGAELRVATIEPAHEALLRQWGLLDGWLKDDFGLLATLEAVQRATRDWDANGRADSWLAHQGQRLADAQALDARADIAAKLDATDRAYLAACRAKEETARAEAETRRREREQEQARRLRDARRLTSVIGVGLVVALAFAGLAVWQWREASTERAAAQHAAQEASEQRDRAEKQTAFAEQQRKAAERAEAEASAQRDLAVKEKAEAEAQKAAADKSAAEAKRQSDRATHALALATQTANGLVFRLAQKFKDVAGVPASLVKDMLDRARALQEQLLAAGEASPDLRRSQAAALVEACDTLLALGDTRSALADARDAERIFEQLLAEAPDSTDFQRELTVADEKVGDVLVAQGDLPAALKAYQDSLAIAERLATADPGNGAWQRDMSVSDEKVGDVLVTQGDLPAALKAYQDSLAIAERLAKADPGNSGWQGDLSVSDNKVGDVLVAQGDLPAALKAYRDSLAIAERLAKADPGNAVSQRDLSVSDEKIGDVLVAQGDLPAALKAYQDSLAIRERLAKVDPGNAGWQRDLSVSDNMVGDVLEGQGDLPAALKAYQDGLTIAERLAKADPGNAGWQSDLAVSDERVGNVLVAQGDLPAALKAYQDCLAIRERLAKADPGNADWQHDLGQSYAFIAYVYLKANRPTKARAALEAGRAILLKLVADHPGFAQWKNDLDWFDAQIAGLGK